MAYDHNRLEDHRIALASDLSAEAQAISDAETLGCKAGPLLVELSNGDQDVFDLMLEAHVEAISDKYDLTAFDLKPYNALTEAANQWRPFLTGEAT